jgi:hypothetical protein
MATSQMLATDTKHGQEAINARVWVPSRGSSRSHQSITWVSSNSRISC